MDVSGAYMNTSPPVTFSVVLNDMDRSDLASYGFRSWALQDIQMPYEVVLNLFNDRRFIYDRLCLDASDYCRFSIKCFPVPKVFNISAANNIGLYRTQGRYVIFANSDIIYPSSFLRILLKHLERFDIDYALCNRINLTERATNRLCAVEEYVGIGAMDFVAGWEYLPDKTMLANNSTPWIISRQVAFAVGGFDPKVFCHEDTDLNVRVMHYLKRMHRQEVLVKFCDLMGYHLWHTGSELYELSRLSKSIIEPRFRRLSQAPNSDEDIVDSQLANEVTLLADLQRPPPLTLYGAVKPLRKAVRSLLGKFLKIIGRRGGE